MDSLYERIAGIQRPRVPVWPLMNHTWLFLEGLIAWSDIKTAMNLNDGEHSQLQEMFNALMVNAAAKPLCLAVPAGDARDEMQRQITFHDSFHLLLAIESERLTKAQVSAYLGVPVP